MRAILASGVALATMWAAVAASAEPSLDPMISSHAVIQRGQPIRVRGTATSGERVTVSLASQTKTVRADWRGRWSAKFSAMDAGGPYRLEARGRDASIAAADDLMVGDVWLCSGQSNMEWPLHKSLNGEGEVGQANDPLLRLMKVPQHRALAPEQFLPPDVHWKPTTPDVAADFSAACYFMVRALRPSHGVAIGAIDSTWGGTAIHSWMDDAAVRATGGAVDIELLQSYRGDPKAAVKAFGERWARWWRQRSGDKAGIEPWYASDRLEWWPMPRIDFWENWGDPAFANWNGAIWARVRFTLTPDEARQGAKLSLGAIDDFDRTFVNGEPVGMTLMWDRPRHYAVPAGLLRAGENEVMLYVLDTGGGGGLWGPTEQLKLALADGSSKPLGKGWEYSVVPTEFGTPPLPPWDERPGVTVLYNGMIAPLGPIGLKGVAWYQGEEDAGKPGYDLRLAAMMANWRGQFAQPTLPFLIVGLAGFGQPMTAPAASSWAVVRDEQRRAVARDPAAALVSAIDIGERTDIHPPNKQEVGRRLALAAKALAYGEGALGPRPLAASRNGDRIIVRFDAPVASYGAGAPVGFELCGEVQASCRYAVGRAEDSTIVVADDGLPATRVRYAWADYPIVNLFGAEMLPVPPFELPIAL